MAIKSGLGASVGASRETTYGTFAAPSRHFLFDTEGLERNQVLYKKKTMQAGSVAQQQNLVRQTTRSAGGPLGFTAVSKGQGIIWDLLTGATVAPTTPVGGTASKQFVFPFGTTPPDGKSLTVQVGIPDTTGTVIPKTLLGGVLESLKFTANVGEALELEAQFAGQDLVYSQALATPTYPTGYEIFGFRESNLTFEGGAVGSCVRSIDGTFTCPKNKDRHCLNGTGLALEPITNDHLTLSGTMVIELTGQAQITAFLNAQWRSLKLACLGLTPIETTIVPSLTIDVPSFILEKATPVVQNMDVVTMSCDYTASISGSNPLANITLVTSDTAL